MGQTTSVTTSYFALDVMGLPEVIYTTEDNLYLHLPSVIMVESGTGDVRYLLGDGLGSIRQAVDESGEVIIYQAFDPYGNPLQPSSVSPQPYGFTGEWWENDLGLLHLRARWYAPETGTFLSVDPMESEPPYQYVRGNPVNLIDPSGMDPPVPEGPKGPMTPYPPEGTPEPSPEPPSTPTPNGTPYPPPPYPQLPQDIVLDNDCYVPHDFSVGGYAEGWSGSLSMLFGIIGVEGSEVVYDFATMERANFTYEGSSNPNTPFVGINISIVELATTIYGVNLNGFESEDGIVEDYS